MLISNIPNTPKFQKNKSKVDKTCVVSATTDGAGGRVESWSGRYDEGRGELHARMGRRLLQQLGA